MTESLAGWAVIQTMRMCRGVVGASNVQFPSLAHRYRVADGQRISTGVFITPQRDLG